MTAERSGTWRRRLWTAGKVALVLALIGAAVYWFGFAPVTVERHAVSSGEVVVEVLGTGTLDAHIKATVSTKIPGRLVKVDVDQGDQVKAGQVVALLDDHDLKHEVEIEEANVTARKAAVERWQADLVHAKATLELATVTEARRRRLQASKAVSQEEYDQSLEALAVARAGLSRAEAALAEGRKQLVAAEKALEFRQARLDDAVIKAPFAGIVVRRDRNPGDVVVPGSSILAVVFTEELWVSAWVDETQMAQLQPGQPGRVVFRSEPDRSYAGKVVRLARETDRETREFLVDVAPGTLPANWSVGQRAEVYIETARNHAEAVVPLRLLVWRDGQPGVFVEVNGRAEWRSVTLGLRGREAAAVLNGLKPGEVVLAPAGANGAKLADGQRVVGP
jgi:RND family efflux transporter MFP subunit